MIRVVVPASTANLGPGFDSLGMALSLYNELETEEIGQGKVIVEVSGEGEQSLPRGSDNLVCRVMADVYQLLGIRFPGLYLRLTNRIPIGKGLGSSAAAVASALVAANHLTGGRLAPAELIRIGTRWEGHPDNVAAALFGGIVITVRDGDEVIWRRFEPPVNLRVVVAVPCFALPTKKSRQALPSMVSMKDAVFNLSRTGMLLLALVKEDLELLRVATKDRLHQPYRASLVPGMVEVFEAAQAAGALGTTLSGAGPTVIAFTDTGEDRIGDVMRQTFQDNGVECKIMILGASAGGARPEDLRGKRE